MVVTRQSTKGIAKGLVLVFEASQQLDRDLNLCMASMAAECPHSLDARPNRQERSRTMRQFPVATRRARLIYGIDSNQSNTPRF